MITIEVTGFQSIANATLKVDGFTALAGKSNIGKSAFIRAVKCALTNPTGTSFVRHGRDCARSSRKNAKTCDCFSTVHVVTDGFDLLWKKGDKVNQYLFNGKEYDKPGQGVPDFLSSVGLDPVKIGSRAESMQVANQFSQLFLLDQSGVAIADAISDVSQLDNINSAIKMVEKEKRSVNETRKVRETDIKGLEVKVSKFDGLEDTLSLVRLADRELERLESQAAKVSKLEQFLRALEAMKKDLTALDSASKVTFPEMSELSDKSLTLSKVYTLMSDLTRRGKEAKTLVELNKSLGDFPEESSLLEASTRTKDLHDRQSRYQKLSRGLASSDVIDTLVIPEVDNLSSLSSKVKAIAAYAARGSVIGKASAELQASVVKLDTEESLIAKDLEPLTKTLSAIEVCPTCTQPVKGNHEHAEDFFPFPD